ncbi:TlpA family protein disulfide reductase [bacterium]|nr:TlpA family protein disulfide reductase [bacterium]
MVDYKRKVMIFFSMFVLVFCVFGARADVILQNLDDEFIPFSSLKGKWVFINYWAGWCSPCLDEIAQLNRFYEKKSTHVAVFAINYDALSLSKQQKLIKKFDIRYPSLKQNSVQALHLGRISVVPITFVFNPQGELATTLYGGQTLKSLNEAMMLNDVNK